jgi:dipeptidyl aminopeptidase/acylaminoacyl peptidase
VNYSYKNKPWELISGSMKENTSLTQITNSTSSEFNAYNWRSPEVITFKAEDGTTVYARLYEPKSDEKKMEPVSFLFTVLVIFKTLTIGGAPIIVNLCLTTYLLIKDIQF